MRTFKRADRVAPLVKEILADLIQFKARDVRVRQVILTRVEIGDDLRLATVYFQVIEGDRTGALKGLEQARSFLRRELGRKLEMKYTPDLRFIYDDSREHVERVERILRQLRTD